LKVLVVVSEIFMNFGGELAVDEDIIGSIAREVEL
jgi:hypothetical protein